MGCGNTKPTSSSSFQERENDSNLERSIERVQMTWTTIKKIDNLGPKVFARVLHVYPVLKRVSNVSQTLKTEADLLRTNEVRDLGNMLLAIYSDLIKNAHLDLNERMQRKALILNRQGIKPRLIKHFGESFYHIATHQINIRLTSEEKQSWLDFTNYISNGLTNQINLGNIQED